MKAKAATRLETTDAGGRAPVPTAGPQTGRDRYPSVARMQCVWRGAWRSSGTASLVCLVISGSLPWPALLGASWNIVGPSVALASTLEWPDGMNTGAPEDVTLKRSDGLVINTPGAVISKVDVYGSVRINAANVTLEKCRVTSNGWAVVQVEAGALGAVVQDCTLDGTGAGPDGTGNQGIMGYGTFLRNNICNVENGITVTGNDTIIQDNYIHDLKAGGDPHYDGIQIDGGISNVVIRHNTIINSHGAAGAIMIDNYFGPISNIVVDNNLLAGGSFTIYSDAKFNSSPITEVIVSNNHIAPGQYGPKLFRGNSPTYMGNSYDGAVLLRGIKSGKRGLRP